MSLYQEHKRRWEHCTLCPLSKVRKHVVLARGKLPCDILFIGEAPGDSEDVLGQPFVGPAGKLLDEVITKATNDYAVRKFDKTYRMAFTNLTACIPNKTKDNHQPPRECIEACEPRLVEFVNLAQPRLIVRVGDLARKYIIGQAQFGDCDWLRGNFMEFADVPHPSRILQANIAEKGLLYQRAIVHLVNAIQDLTVNWR